MGCSPAEPISVSPGGMNIDSFKKNLIKSNGEKLSIYVLVELSLPKKHRIALAKWV
jgi:hypothetical protein